MTEQTNTENKPAEAEQNPADDLVKEREDRKALADKMRNHMHVLLSQSPGAVQRAHAGMCSAAHDHASQPHMSSVLSANLVISEMARQAVEEFNK